MSKSKISGVSESDYGILIALDENGRYIVDSDYNHLCIPHKRGEKTSVQKLIEAARHYGFENIRFEFRENARQITEDEYQEQLLRMQWGLIPDPMDVGALKDEFRGRKA